MEITKRILISLLPVLAVIALTASSNPNLPLKIYRLQGEVTLQTPFGERKVQRRDALSLSDVLRIPSGGRIEILDSDSHRIYSSTSTGLISVRKLLEKAVADASDVTKKTNAKVVESVKENAKTRASYNVTGLSVHETDGLSQGLLALPSGVTYLAYLMNLSTDQSYDDKNDVILIRRDYSDSDDTFNFAVFNTLDCLLYVNVIDQHPDGELRFYFTENPVVKPRAETLIPEYRYLLPVKTTGYIVIASDANFTIDDVKRLLDSNYSPNQSFFYSLLCI